MDGPRPSGFGDSLFPSDWYQVVRLLGGILVAFCLVVGLLALWRGVSVTRYLGPLAVTVGGSPGRQGHPTVSGGFSPR
jgi:hypothetical protein